MVLISDYFISVLYFAPICVRASFFFINIRISGISRTDTNQHLSVDKYLRVERQLVVQSAAQ